MTARNSIVTINGFLLSVLNKMIPMVEVFKIIAELGKFRITAFVSITTIAGYILFSGKLDLTLFFTTVGLFLLASGSSVLNHLQERDSDAKMLRTKSRPLPSGKISPTQSIFLAGFFVISASVVLCFAAGFIPLILALFSLFWYNGVYTPLKRISAYAVIPGSLIGALPPLVGWTAAGGGISDEKILAFALFLFIWQIPHFWLLALIHGEDYQRAGFPTLTDKFSGLQIGRMIFAWITALVSLSIFITYIDSTFNILTILSAALSGIWLIFSVKKILITESDTQFYRKSFININIYVLLIILILSIDRLF